MASEGQHVDAERSHIERKPPCDLCCINQYSGTMRMRQRNDLVQRQERARHITGCGQRDPLNAAEGELIT